MPQFMPRYRDKQVAFTLVDLLVVIAVMAILIAILLPTLQQAKRRTMVVLCLNNMRQMAIGLERYVQENNFGYPEPPFDYFGAAIYDLCAGPDGRNKHLETSWTSRGSVRGHSVLPILQVLDEQSAVRRETAWSLGAPLLALYQFRCLFLCPVAIGCSSCSAPSTLTGPIRTTRTRTWTETVFLRMAHLNLVTRMLESCPT